MKPIAMIDIDGVLFPYADPKPGYAYDTGAFAEVVSLLQGRPLATLAPIKSWSFYKEQWGMTTAEFLDCMRRGVLEHDLFARKPPFEGSAVAMTYLHSLGVEIHLVTNRVIDGAVEAATAQTIQWCADWGITYDKLVVSKDKVMNGFMGYAWSIDDNVDNYDALADAGCNPYLLDRPWNQGHGGQRVSSLMEFVITVRKDLGQ